MFDGLVLQTTHLFFHSFLRVGKAESAWREGLLLQTTFSIPGWCSMACAVRTFAFLYFPNNENLDVVKLDVSKFCKLGSFEI